MRNDDLIIIINRISQTVLSAKIKYVSAFLEKNDFISISK